MEEKMTRNHRLTSLTVSVFVLAALLVLSACVPNVIIRPPSPNIVINTERSATPGASPEIPGANADRQFIQNDDYFVLDNDPAESGYTYAFVAKMITPPSEATRNQAQFLITQSASTVWTEHYRKSRLATRQDLRLGREIIFYDAVDANNHYRSPDNNVEARSGTWVLSRIVDLGELFKNVVMVSDGMRVKETAIRVMVD